MQQAKWLARQIRIRDGIIFKIVNGVESLIVKKENSERVLEQTHEGHSHPGTRKLQELMLRGYWWSSYARIATSR